LYDRGLFL